MTSHFVKAYTINEVSKIINVPPGTLRQWEKDLQGLLTIPRSKQGARLYTDDEIKLLEKIKQMRDKNLSKDMIKELMQRNLVEDAVIAPLTPTISANSIDIHPEDVKDQMGLFLTAMETFREQLINDVRAEIRTGIRKEVLEEVKKEVSKGSLHTVKSLSDSIYKANETTKLEILELSNHLHNASEQTSESLGTLTKRIAKASKGTSEQIRYLANRVTQSSEAASEEFKTMIHYISSSAEVTHTEISALIETLNTDREIYIESINREREKYWKDVNKREMMFQDMIDNFRSAAASAEETKKPWWKFWQ